MDIEKLFKEFVEKEWHDGHEPQGGYDHYDEDEELDEKFEKEARSYIDRKKKEKEKKDYKKKYGREPFSFSGKHMSRKHSMGIAAEFDPELDEGYKDLPPHLQKLVKKIEKKQKDWNKQNPNAKIKTLVYNPDTGKPDIEVKENTMKLVDTVKQVLDEHCGVCGEQGIEEDSDPEEKGTQGDDKEYQAKRDEILKGYGVKACGLIKDEKTKAQCFKDLDDAHVADHEEGYGYNPHPPEGKPTAKKHKAHKSDASPDVGKISEAFWKVNIPDMPPIFVEASSASEIKKDMRTKLRPDVVKELAIERVSKSEMIKKYREMAKGGGDEEETSENTKVKEEVKTDSKMYSYIKRLMKEEDLDDMKDDLRDLQRKLRDKASYRNSQVGWKEDEYEALEKRIDKKRAAIKDVESRTKVVDKYGSTLTRAS